MFELKTVVPLNGVAGKQIADFLLECDDAMYQHWWPGTHLQWHTKDRTPNIIGSVVYFDEYVGKRRLKLDAIVVRWIPERELIWQIKKFVKLPVWLIISFEDTPTGTILTHRLRAGISGIGRFLDPLFKLFFNPQFDKDMDEHANFEFNKLATMLA